jgi:hypothetical protein
VAYRKKLVRGSLNGCRRTRNALCCRPLPRTEIGRKNDIVMRRTVTSIDTLAMERGLHVAEVMRALFVLLDSVVDVILLLELVLNMSCVSYD